MMEAVLIKKGSFRFAVKRKHRIYVLLNESGALAAWDPDMGEWEIVSVLPGSYFSFPHLFFSMEKDENTLFVISGKEAEILIYDFTANTYEEKRFSFDGRLSKEAYVYEPASVLEYGSRFIFLPFQGEELLMFEKGTSEWIVCSGWKEDLINYCRKAGEEFLFIRKASSCIVEDTLYGIAKCEMRDVVFSVSLKDMKVQNIDKIQGLERLFRMEPEGGIIWIQNGTDAGNRLICWNPKSQKVEKETGFLHGGGARLLKCKNVGGYLCAGFLDGRVLFLDASSLEIKQQENQAFWYEIGNSEILLAGERELRVVNLNEWKYREMPSAETLRLRGFLELVKKEKAEPEEMKTPDVGRLIYRTICLNGK